MSFITYRESQCDGKKRFVNPTLAHRIAERRNKRDRESQVYRCTHCGGWHIGTPIKIMRAED